MSQRRKGLFRQAARNRLRSKRLGRLLRSELLEPRCALHGDSLAQELLPAIRPFPGGLNHSDPLVRAAIAGITTTASADQYAFVDAVAPRPALETKHHPGEALEESGVLIGVPAFRSDPRFSGIDGTGYSVVFLDTGIDLDHPFFGPDEDGNQVADRIVFNADFITGRPNAEDTRGHGTHVSSIAASQDSVYSGVAPGSGIIHLRVLDDDGFGTAQAIESALQWVVANAETYNVASVNMSLSFGDNASSPTTRPDLGIGDELAALAAQGVITVSASGNSYFNYGGAPGVSYPAADPNSLSIGAVWDAAVQGPVAWASGAQDFTTGPDRIVSFSQRHPTLTTVFAPGAQITAAAIGGGVTVISGTSMAAPHIAGMAAVMQQLAVQTTGQRLSVSQFTEMLSATGEPIFDGDDEDDNVLNTNLEFRRADMVAMANAIVSGGLSDLALAGEIGTRSSTAPAGGRMRLNFTIANQGLTSTGAFAGDVYLSTDEVIDSSDILLGSFEENLGAGQSSRRTGYAVDLPSSVAAGNYFLGIVLDGQSVVEEANEQNNPASIQISVTDPAPDVWLQDASSGLELPGSGPTIDFGQTLSGGADVVKRFKIYNDGASELALSALTIPTGYSVASFPATVAPLASAEFEVSLLASSGDARYVGDITFSTDDPDATSLSFRVAGTVDFGATAETASVIPLNSTVSAAIATAGDVDWFRFDAMSGVEYQIETTLGTLLDSVVRIRDAAGVELAMNDDSPTGLNSKLAWTPTIDGAYYIEVIGKQLRTGTYELSLAAGDDHGDDAATATVTTDPSVNFGGIEAPGDVDWFSFEARAGVDYHVEVVVGTLPAAALRLFDASGVELAATAGSGPATTLIEWRAPANGIYYLAVAGASPSMVGSYQLLVTGADDHGDNAANATLVSTPGVALGVIEVRDDLDWFAFDAVEGARYELSTQVHGRSDTRLRLIDRNGAAELGQDVSGGPGTGSLLQWTAPESGRYFIEIGGVGQRFGNYTLSVSIRDDHGNDAAGATPTTDPSNNPGVIESATDEDWFVFEALAGVAYRAEQTAGALSQVVLSVIGPDGQPVPTTGVGPAAVEWTAASSGPFYIVVEAASGAQLGDYVIRLTGEDDHGDNAANATPLIVPGNLPGVLQGLDDHDWFSFASVVGLDYRFETTLDAPAVVRLYERDGATLIAEARGESGAPAVLHWTPIEPGEFYLELAQQAATPAAETLPVAVNYALRSIVTGRAPGDYVDDLNVDGHDFLLWQQSVSSTTDLRADGNNDGVVDGADLAIWAERYGPVFGDRAIVSSASAPAAEAPAVAGAVERLGEVHELGASSRSLALPWITGLDRASVEVRPSLRPVLQRARADHVASALDQAIAVWRLDAHRGQLFRDAIALDQTETFEERCQSNDVANHAEHADNAWDEALLDAFGLRSE
jgi:hypothetical protein